ncbi:hypothetical protein PSTT_03464 [Puccinia striiformis]|uniref:Tc1-like transposase DDE domain-containing protein n=1 Tax=Puccinia striiformis TaxID=27350 RepID=A0A2S4VWF3_9BASI|nr:hypothetical protein PSTT_03464 [Puccinia striiformis]
MKYYPAEFLVFRGDFRNLSYLPTMPTFRASTYPQALHSQHTRGSDGALKSHLSQEGSLSSTQSPPSSTHPQLSSSTPAIGMNGVLALTVRDNMFNAKKFPHFLKWDLLPRMNPYPGPNSALVCDNATVHKGRCVHALCDKSRLRRTQELSYSLDAHWSIRTTFVDVITQEFCYDIYRHCGYHITSSVYLVWLFHSYTTV